MENKNAYTIKDLDPEFAMINDRSTLEFTRLCLTEICPPDHYFWTASATSSGKYHNEVSRGPGGLVRHTKLAVKWAYHLKNLFPNANEDYAYAALILHDVCKFDEPRLNHGLKAAIEIGVRRHKFFPQSRVAAVSYIATAVQRHMGLWSDEPDSLLGMDEVSALVHLADYVSSRDLNA